MEGGGAFGAGKATGQFDPISFAKKPQVIVRALSWLFSIIVFGCISSQGYYEESICRYNGDQNACNFGVTVGVLAFLALMVFLILDALFDNISSIQQRKYVVMADIAFSGLWTFLYFVNFCYLADAWRKTDDGNLLDGGKSGVEAAIAFSFFSIATFAGSTVLAVMRYRTGITEEFAQPGQPGQPGFPGEGGQQSGYPSYPSTGPDPAAAADPYQQQHGGFNQGQFQGQQQPGGFQGQQQGGGFQGQQPGAFQQGGGFQSEQKMPAGDFQPPTY